MSKASKGLLIAVIMAVLIRLSVFAITALCPITGDSGNVISPAIANGTDILFYQNQKHEMFSAPVNDLVTDYITVPQSNRGMIAGPLFPTLLYLFRYESGNSWPLAGLYLIGSILLVLSWLKWLHGQEIPWFWLMVFALIPNPIY